TDLNAASSRKKFIDVFGALFKSCRSEEERQKMLADLSESLEMRRPKASDVDEDLKFVGSDDMAKVGSFPTLTIASHAMTHNFLDSLPYEQQVDELEQSHLLLSKHSSSYFPAVAYPGGSFNAATIEIAKQIYKCAFSLDMISSYQQIYAY